MDIQTNFRFSFSKKEQLREFIDILVREDRLRRLVAAYKIFNNPDEKENYLGEFVSDIDVSDNVISGNGVICFNEWDPSQLLPKVFKEISEKYSDSDFDGEIEEYWECCGLDEGPSVSGKYYYKNGKFEYSCEENDSSYDEDDEDDDIDFDYTDDEEFDFMCGNKKNQIYEIENGSPVFPQGLTEIDKNAFRNCDELTSVIIPDGVKYIGDSAFDGCSDLVSVTFPETVLEIREFAFSGTALASITMPLNVRKICDYAFSNCISLVNVVLSENLTEIGESAFEGCGLNSIIIPASVTQIGKLAFHLCFDLTIHAPAGSYAEQYAKKNKIKFKALE